MSTNAIPLFFKAHVDTYTRKDGSVVPAHDDKRQAASAPAGKHDVKLIEGTMDKPGGYSVNGKEFTGDEHEELVDEAKQMSIDTGKPIHHILRQIAPKHHFE